LVAIAAVSVVATASGCLSGASITGDWQDADMRVTSDEAAPLASDATSGLVASFDVDQQRRDVVATFRYRTGSAATIGLEGPDGGQDLKVFHANAGDQARDESWVKFSTLDAGTYTVFAVPDERGTLDVQFALGLYWDGA
jgi:hypothetical protein